MRKLKAELRRVTEERDILKEATVKYTFIKSRLKKYSVSVMCHVLEVQRSGFYAWLKQPLINRAREYQRLLGQIKQSWMESGFAYGYRNITRDLKDSGISHVALNTLDRQFEDDQPNKIWVTDFTYIRTHEG